MCDVTHRVFHLAFVRLDLVLEFVDDVLVSVLRLAVLVCLEGELLNRHVTTTLLCVCMYIYTVHEQNLKQPAHLEASVLALEPLGRLGVPPLFVVQLNLQLTHSLLHLLQHPLPALQRVRLRLVQTHLQLLHLQLERAARALHRLRMLLLVTQVVGHLG